jgi:copper chaperone CopZ
MQKWRPVFLGVTFVLLGVAWYLTYRKTKADACGEGTTCAGRRSAKTAKVILWVGTVLAVAVAAVPLYAGAVARLVHGESAGAARAAGSNVASLTVKIPDMDCQACAVNIERALVKVEGIVRAEIVFKTKQGVIAYDPARIAPEKVIRAVDETGFKAEPITRLEKR